MINIIKKKIKNYFDIRFNKLYNEIKLLGKNNSDNKITEYYQYEAYQQILSLLKFDKPIPQLRGSAISPDAALLIIDHLISVNPGTFVEFGSGVSSILWAQTIKRFGLQTKIYSFDHLEKFLEITNNNLIKHGLNDHIKLEYAPLKEIELDHKNYNWYDTHIINKSLSKIEKIDLVFIEGPPRNLKSSYLRYPVVPILKSKLFKDSTVFLDDSNRADEKFVIEKWLSSFSTEVMYTNTTEKGLFKMRFE